MKKPFRFDELSNIVCCESNCNKKIKMNLIVKKPVRAVIKSLRCYKCFILLKKKSKIK